MNVKPIKRTRYLKELSRDHHFGLLFCWKLKEGLKNHTELKRLGAYVSFFWNGHLKDHFEEEERLLFNGCNDVLCEQALSEHQLVYDQVHAIQTGKSPDTPLYVSLIETVNRHIRFEERTVFPHLEQTLPEATLISVEKELSRGAEPVFIDDFPDEFWVKS